MRLLCLAVLIALAACPSKTNPDVCCASEAQCDDLGADELLPCKAGQACGPDHLCVAAECTNNADCDAAAPICRLGLCESSCAGNDDCADVAGRPYCSADAVCVGCSDASQCPASAAICDAEEHACRGCERDDECASGVCVESSGLCAAEDELLFVVGVGSDTGDCTRQSPCRTIGYAYTKVGISNRHVIRVTGSGVGVSTSTLSVMRPIVIDGTGTMINKPTTGPSFSVSPVGALVLGGVSLEGNDDSDDPALVVNANTTATLGPGATLRGTVRSAGTLVIDRARIETTISCMNGTLDIGDATITARPSLPYLLVSGMNCNATIRRSRFTANIDKQLALVGGMATIENNVFASGKEYADIINIKAVQSGSVFRFNTVVNVTGSDTGDGVALDCDSSVDVSNNIFAYRSQHPFTSAAGCLVKFSIIDDVALAPPTPPLDSSFHPFDSLFVNAAAADFHPSAGSPAIGAGDPASTVTEDLEHNPRPSPSGSRPDVGAYELP